LLHLNQLVWKWCIVWDGPNWEIWLSTRPLFQILFSYYHIQYYIFPQSYSVLHV
jgi:hypothetical protein